jgi:hypothetical protein
MHVFLQALMTRTVMLPMWRCGLKQDGPKSVGRVLKVAAWWLQWVEKVNMNDNVQPCVTRPPA